MMAVGVFCSLLIITLLVYQYSQNNMQLLSCNNTVLLKEKEINETRLKLKKVTKQQKTTRIDFDELKSKYDELKEQHQQNISEVKRLMEELRHKEENLKYLKENIQQEATRNRKLEENIEKQRDKLEACWNGKSSSTTCNVNINNSFERKGESSSSSSLSAVGTFTVAVTRLYHMFIGFLNSFWSG